jgi:hypothetical protein
MKATPYGRISLTHVEDVLVLVRLLLAHATLEVKDPSQCIASSISFLQIMAIAQFSSLEIAFERDLHRTEPVDQKRQRLEVAH